MTRWLPIVLLAQAPLVVWGQQPPAGMPPEWETRKTLDSIVAQVERFQPFLAQLNPREWLDKGASPTYESQLKAAQEEIRNLRLTATRLMEKPDRATVALETYLRFLTVDSLLLSLKEAIGKYQNQALAELLEGMIADNGRPREALRQYLIDLTADREQQLYTIRMELDRCRTDLARPTWLKRLPPQNP